MNKLFISIYYSCFHFSNRINLKETYNKDGYFRLSQEDKKKYWEFRAKYLDKS